MSGACRIAAGSSPLDTVTSILVDVDAGAASQPALARAATIARECGARLRIVDVMPALAEARGALRADLDDEWRARRHSQLAFLMHGLRDIGAQAGILAGPPVDALIADVERHRHDLLVRSHARDVVARGTSPDGSVDAQLFQRCPCPVWAVGPGPPVTQPRIVAAVDVGTTDPVRQALNRRIVELALLLTRLQHGSLVLLHGWQPLAERHFASRASDTEYAVYVDDARHSAKHRLVALALSFGSRLGNAQLELRRGGIDRVLPTYVLAEGVDLVVMGTIGRTGIVRHLVRSTAERLLDRLPCSLLVVKPPTAVASSVRVGALA